MLSRMALNLWLVDFIVRDPLKPAFCMVLLDVSMVFLRCFLGFCRGFVGVFGVWGDFQLLEQVTCSSNIIKHHRLRGPELPY